MGDDLYSFSISSRLAASPSDVWASVSTMAGVNAELRPFLKMTCPVRDGSLDSSIVPIGRRAFRSYLLLFGALPIDYDDITLVRIEPGRGFTEASEMLSLRSWRHERTIEPTEDGRGSIVTDRIGFTPRAPVRRLEPVFKRICEALFRWRHKQLRAKFGEAA
jgi:ligand-binding SRPBCC domain-containing protein